MGERPILIVVSVAVIILVTGLVVVAMAGLKGPVAIFNLDRSVRVTLNEISATSSVESLWTTAGIPERKLIVTVIPWRWGSNGSEKLYGKDDVVIAAAQAKQWLIWEVVTLGIKPGSWADFSADATTKSLNHLILQAAYKQLTGNDRVPEDLYQIWIGGRDVSVVNPFAFEIH